MAAASHFAWAIDGSLSPLPSSSNTDASPTSPAFTTAHSSPSTPQPPPQQQQPQYIPQQHLPRLAPTQPLNIARRQPQRLPSNPPSDFSSTEGDYLARSLLRERDPLPPPSGLPPPPPPQQHHRSTSNLPATASAVPPPRPPRPPIGLGITTPVLPPSQPSSSSQLLSPVSPYSASTTPITSVSGRHRPSSRRALTRALELAQEAVEFDKLSDAQRAVDAYGKSVALLGEVMERVLSGGGERERERERERDRGGRRRSVSARDEEVKRLRAIHDTYADRMRILCVLHAVQPSSGLPAYIQNILTPTSATFPPPSPTVSLAPADAEPPAPEVTAAIGSTFVALGLEGEEEREEESVEGLGAGLRDGGREGRSGASTPSGGAVLVQGRVAAQQPHIVSVSRPHSRSASHSASPSPAPTLVPGPGPVPPATISAGRSIPPARPPPSSILPPIPPPSPLPAPLPTNKSPPLRQQQSLSSLRDTFALQQPGSPTTPTPSSPPRKVSGTPAAVVTRQARSASLSGRPGGLGDVPPVPPLPPMPPTAAEKSQLVASTTNQGSIAQRRRAGAPTPALPPVPAPGVPTIKLPPQPRPPSQPVRPPTAPAAPIAGLRAPSSSGQPQPQQGRLRAVSQPGSRPPFPPPQAGTAGIPDVPSLSRTGSSSALSSVQGTPAALPVPLPPSTLGIPGTPVPLSPLPLPSDLALRPFHLMRSLLLSILHPPGFYLTPRLFIPTALWSQGGAKLLSLPQKVTVLLTLSAGLEELKRASEERERERRGGWATEGAGAEERWEAALGEWERVCEGVRESTRGKGGFQGVGDGTGKGGKGLGGMGLGRLGRQLEKIANGKNLDSPAAYVHALTKLFQSAPILELHLKSFLHPNSSLSLPANAPSYTHLTPAQRAALEQRLRRSAEFFAGWVVPFVVKDLGLLMEKYLKKGEKWLVE